MTERLIDDLLALTLVNVEREYPNGIQHFMWEDGDVPSVPRQLHPAFYGCLDWHSAVHSHWQLVRAIRFFPDGAFVAAARGVLDKHLTAERLAVEFAYLERRRGYERPYGLAWLLQLCAELREWGTADGLRWLRPLQQLEMLAAERIAMWLPTLSHPVRSGGHNQTAFSLGLVHDWAQIAGREQIAAVVADNARRFFLEDRDAPLRYEPSGTDFLSPALAEADLMRRILSPTMFAAWLRDFLPADAANWLQPVRVGDASDGQLAHFAGLNVSRAWMLEGIAAALPEGDSRIAGARLSAEAHRAAGLLTATSDEYMVSHWVPTFTVYLLTSRGVLR